MKRSFVYFIPALVCLAAVSCSKQDPEKIQEKGRIEGGAQADAGFDRDRDAASLMEEDLAARFDFYESNSGHFEGSLTDGSTQFKIRISLFPNLPRYKGPRKRSQAEVQYDLTTLALNAQITQWNPLVPTASMGCRVEGLRPDIATGKLSIISSSCPSSYFLVLNRTSIDGTAQPSSYPAQFTLQASRLP